MNGHDERRLGAVMRRRRRGEPEVRPEGPASPRTAAERRTHGAPAGEATETLVRRTHRDYVAYGLHVRSSIALPFTPVPVPPAGEPDVTVRIGEVPDTLPAPADGGGEALRREAAPRPFERKIRNRARYLVTGGRDILVEPLGSSDHEVGAFLTGSMFAALLRQRNVVAFHASAIETGMGAVLFMGVKGSGKSSLLAAFVDRGYAMLADDMTGVVLDAGGRAVALPAFPDTRLWTDTLDALGWQGRKREKVPVDGEKYLVPVERFRDAPLAVGAVCVLESRPEEGIEVETAPTDDALWGLWRYTSRGRSLRRLGQRPVYLRTIATMAKRVPVMCVTRPAHPFRLGALADRIEESLQELQTAAGAPPVTPIEPGAGSEKARRSHEACARESG